jgi:hypothetical protein
MYLCHTLVRKHHDEFEKKRAQHYYKEFDGTKEQ